ncbi:SPOR domain-containing protein [Halovulum sp. GXIMD14794]
MSRQVSRNRPGQVLGVILLGAALTGCDQFDGVVAASSGEAQPAATASVRVEERDRERPDIFEIKAKGLWDGRYSFGDRWVAVAAPVKADRVKIVNLANGREIEGALFQKEENLPGPPIMVSQNAAEALNMLPGTPVEMRVVVVRREVVQVQPDGTAAVPIAESGQSFKIGSMKTESIPGTIAPAAVAPAAATSAAQTEAEPEASTAPAAQGISTGALQTTTLAATPAAAAAKPAAAKPQAAAASAKPPSKPYIQVVNGGNKDGAEVTLKRLKDNGLAGLIQPNGPANAQLYRVVAGPFSNQASFDAAMAEIKGLGYGDAFAIK